MAPVYFLGYRCIPVFSRYPSGAIRLDLKNPSEGPLNKPRPVVAATGVYIEASVDYLAASDPGLRLAPDELVINEWGDTEGLSKSLRDAGILRGPLDYWMHKSRSLPIARLGQLAYAISQRQ